MPQLVVTSSRTGPTSGVVPPASAFQPPIRILKRSVAPTQQYANDGSPTSIISGTFAERSARYNAARERIFAGTTEGSTGVGEGGAVQVIVRNPKGPPEHAQGPNGQDTEGSQGFGTRVGKRGITSQPDDKQVTNSRT
jgi:SUZ domain